MTKTKNSGSLSCYAMMESLDQALMIRQGQIIKESDNWGDHFFEVLDTMYPDWARRFMDVYRVASKVLCHFLNNQADPNTVRAVYLRPDFFVKTVILMLESGYEP